MVTWQHMGNPVYFTKIGCYIFIDSMYFTSLIKFVHKLLITESTVQKLDIVHN